MPGIVVTCEVVLEVQVEGYRLGTSFAEIAQDAIGKAHKTIDNALSSFGRPPHVRQIGLPKPVTMRADWCLGDAIDLSRLTSSEEEPPPP
jgi:hypothetical protein